MAIIKGFTPSMRGPSIGDGLGGNSERPSAREADPVLRNPGWITTDIRLSPTSTDVSTGTPAVAGLYDFGMVTQEARGQYVAMRQGAASATADPLGARVYTEFDILEASAGVFTATTRVIDELDVAGTGTSNDNLRQTDVTLIAVADAELDGANSDSRATIFVATAADVTDAAAWTATDADLVQGHLYLLDAVAAGTHVFEIERTR
jgi:hypothetical protein